MYVYIYVYIYIYIYIYRVNPSNPTLNCPLPRLRRPPADLNAATTEKDCEPSGAPLVGQRTQLAPEAWRPSLTLTQ